MRSLGRSMTDELVKKLRANTFFIIVEETTDIATNKACTVVVNYLDTVTNTIKTRHLELFDVYAKQGVVGSTGQNSYNLLIDTLSLHQIPLENCIGFAEDGASNIMGQHNSLCSKLRE